MRIAGIYLREEDEYVGPFQSRDDAIRFLELMQAFGEDCAGIQIVEFEESETGAGGAVTPPERRELLGRAEGDPKSLPERSPEGEELPHPHGKKRKTAPHD